jgi:oxygen-independent coproporphyrinogen-3 oxidase
MYKDRFGVYIHIPFCVKKCNYCDFLSFAADEDAKQSYVNALISEINGLEGDSRPVASIFIGGGTPSVLKASQIASVLEAVYGKFTIAENVEITIECNPETLTREKAESYIKSGINRISFGLQSADNSLLKVLGRIHTYEKFLESFQIARECGFHNINVDMMAALPGQSVENYLDGLCRVAELEPEHISAYSLIVEEGTSLYDNIGNYPELPDEDAEREMYHKTKDLLAEYGYRRYEISNFAKQGFESRHNMSYWELTDYVGVGLGASGFYKGYRYKNTSDMAEYLNHAFIENPCEKSKNDYSRNPQEFVCSENSFINSAADNQNLVETGHFKFASEINKETRADLMEEFMFLGLRKMDGISYAEFKSLFGCDIMSVYSAQIEKNCRNGLLEEYTAHGGLPYLRLTEHGIDISNVVMSDFCQAD